jgi:hypothetical protein
MVRPLVAVVMAAVLAGCTTVVVGRGKITIAASSPSAIPSSTPTSTAPPPTASLTVPHGTGWPPAGLLRFAPATAIGDPVTADLCAAIGLGTLRGLGNGLTPSFDTRQYPPGCSATLKDHTTPVLSVSVYGSSGAVPAAPGRVDRVVAGLTVYQFPFDAATGECRRELNPLGILLTIDSLPLRSAKPDQALDCASTDAMTTRIAKLAARGTQPPQLLVPARSLSALDACKVVDAAEITGLPAFHNGTVTEQGFGASCEVRPASGFLFFNYVIVNAARPNGAQPKTVEGHQFYETSAQPTFCSYVSTQGTTRDGRYEQLAATATTTSSKPPAQLCEQTAQALARYLSAAGLS